MAPSTLQALRRVIMPRRATRWSGSHMAPGCGVQACPQPPRTTTNPSVSPKPVFTTPWGKGPVLLTQPLALVNGLEVLMQVCFMWRCIGLGYPLPQAPGCVHTANLSAQVSPSAFSEVGRWGGDHTAAQQGAKGWRQGQLCT